MGKRITCSQMWSSYFRGNKSDLKESPVSAVTQGSGVWSFTKQGLHSTIWFSLSGFVSLLLEEPVRWGMDSPSLGRRGRRVPLSLSPQCTSIIFLIINTICADYKILNILDINKAESKIPLNFTPQT